MHAMYYNMYTCMPYTSFFCCTDTCKCSHALIEAFALLVLETGNSHQHTWYGEGLWENRKSGGNRYSNGVSFLNVGQVGSGDADTVPITAH